MKMLVFLDVPFQSDGERHFTQFADPQFFKYLVCHFDKIVICAPTQKVKKQYKLGNFIILEELGLDSFELPFWSNTTEFVRRLPLIFSSLLRRFRMAIKDSDIIWIRMPSIAGIFLFLIAKLFYKPVILFIAGHIKEAWKGNPKYLGYKKVFVSFISDILDRITRILIQGSFITFVVGQELKNHYGKASPKVFFAIDSLVSEKDIFVRKDTCLKTPINLLFVGKFVPVKGIKYLLKAFKNLNRRYDMNLILVGSGPLENELYSQIEKFGIRNKVKFLGYIPGRKELFKVYRRADILIIPSLHESFGRVILEAWASGVPIIATRVGGIRYLIDDQVNGLLINPMSSSEIAESVKKIIDDPELRERLIKNGYQSILQYTTEIQVKKIVKLINTKFARRKL